MKLSREQLKKIIYEELEMVLEEGGCPDDGCIQKREKGWIVVSNKTGKCWGRSKKEDDADCTYYGSRADAKNALDAYFIKEDK